MEENKNVVQQEVKRFDTASPYSAVVTAVTLNVREAPSLSSKALTILRENQVVEISTVTKRDGAEWGKIDAKNGWVNLEFLKKVE